MKKQVFRSVELGALLFPMGLFAQNNTTNEATPSPIPMFAEGVKWDVVSRTYETEWEPGLMKVYDVGTPYQYGVQGKETINNKEYFHLTTTKGKEAVDFYAREEGTKVFVYKKDKNKEFAVFDYTIKPGEKYVGKGLEVDKEGFYETFLLDSIKVQNVAGADRRVYYFTRQWESKSFNAPKSGEAQGDPSTSNINTNVDLVWIEGIGTRENTPFYQPKGMTGRRPDILLAYTDAKGVQHTPTGLPAEWSWKKLIRTTPTALDNVDNAPASICIRDGKL